MFCAQKFEIVCSIASESPPRTERAKTCIHLGSVGSAKEKSESKK